MSEQGFISSKEKRAKKIVGYKHNVETLRQRELSASSEDFPWLQIDAGLLTGQHSIQEWFRRVLPPHRRNIKKYIEESFRDTERRTALEIGGTGSRLFGEFSDGFFDRTLGINLTDYRDEATKQMDQQRNHNVIAGNAFDPEKQSEIIDWVRQGKGKIDVIFERMYAGSQMLPKEPFFLSKQANFYYGLLDEGGLMFAEIPPVFDEYLALWKKQIDTNYSDQLEVQISKFTVPNEDRKVNVIRLKKLKGAPIDLPLLDARTVLATTPS